MVFPESCLERVQCFWPGQISHYLIMDNFLAPSRGSTCAEVKLGGSLKAKMWRVTFSALIFLNISADCRAFFHDGGKIPWDSDALNSLVRNCVITGRAFAMTLCGMPSSPFTSDLKWDTARITQFSIMGMFAYYATLRSMFVNLKNVFTHRKIRVCWRKLRLAPRICQILAATLKFSCGNFFPACRKHLVNSCRKPE